MTKIYFDVAGAPVPAEESTWVKFAPCGCECGWADARYYLDEEQARAAFFRSMAVHRRDEKLGYRVEIKRHSDIRIQERCPHSPEHGVEPRPVLEGHTWAAKDKGRTLHLVPLAIEDDSWLSSRESVAAVCGRADAYAWSTEDRYVDGLVECTVCVKAAAERAGGAA